MKKALGIFVLILFMMNLNAQESKTLLTYWDGSGNSYTISSDSLHYLPIEPKNSSSGTYSGGEKKDISITSEEFKSIEESFNAIFQNSDLHIDKRIMTSGVLIKNTETSENNKIIVGRCEELIQFEDILSSLRKE